VLGRRRFRLVDGTHIAAATPTPACGWIRRRSRASTHGSSSPTAAPKSRISAADGHRAVEPAVRGAIDLSHAARPDRRDDLARAETRSRQEALEDADYRLLVPRRLFPPHVRSWEGVLNRPVIGLFFGYADCLRPPAFHSTLEEVPMTARRLFSPVAVVLALSTLVAAAPQGTQKPTVKIPEPGVPQIMTLEDRFVRIAYNNEGYVSLGYRLANGLVGKDWILIEVGMTVRDGKPNYKIKRSDISLTLPDNSKVPLPTNPEYREVDLRAIENQSKVINDSINYFPPSVRSACRIGFFSEMSSGTLAYEEVELSSIRGCVGRLYFKVPGGLKHGQYFLNVQFLNSLVRVPFRIMTAEEEKMLSKNWKDIKKQVDEAFKKGGK
jgi:hypothetical protein